MKTPQRLVAIAVLAVLILIGQTQAEASTFALACTFKGGAYSFVVSGDYVKGEAYISRAGGGLSPAFVRWDFNTVPKPVLAILVRGKGHDYWRDLYIIDTALGTFTHVNEIFASPDKELSMAVQGGTCIAAR